MPLAPCTVSDLAPARHMLIMVFHSTTSKSTLMPTSARFCWMYSFIGSGCIWPEPEAEIRILTLTGLDGP